LVSPLELKRRCSFAKRLGNCRSNVKRLKNEQERNKGIKYEVLGGQKDHN
jgi:hypothetical protein